jgi:hypothetical protein
MGKQLIITKGAKFGQGKEGPLTVSYDNEQCINIGTLYDASGAPVETASKKNKREARGKGQEPATVGGGAAVTAPAASHTRPDQQGAQDAGWAGAHAALRLPTTHQRSHHVDIAQ